MSVTTTVKDTLQGTARTLAEARKPLYASLGATELAARTAKARAAGLSGQAKELRGTVVELSGRATAVYGDLAARGEKVLASVRKQPATERAASAAASAATTAAAKAKAARAKAARATTGRGQG